MIRLSAVMMADGYDCAFGSRFMRGTKIVDYPVHKLAINRMANWFIRMLFRLRYNDITHAFKCYRRQAIDGYAAAAIAVL